MSSPLPASLLSQLRAIDTCSIADAIERTDIRLHNEGFSSADGLRCHFPELSPMVGYAVTLRVRTANPPMQGGRYAERTDWWDQLAAQPAPHVLLVEDVDRHPGHGAFLGETHAAMFQALGCVGIVTNGSVRSLPAMRLRGLPVFSGSVSPSHAYVHVVDAGMPINVSGLRVAPGDLIHGDGHGVIRVPAAVAGEIPEIVERIRVQKQRIIDLCDSPSFSREQLRELMKTSQA